MFENVTTHKKSLRSLIDRLDWKAIQVYKGVGKKLSPDKIMVLFSESKKRSGVIDKMTLRMGKDVLEKLNWNIGDRIVPHHDPDDILTFLMVKSEHSTGFKLTPELNSHSAKISFKWSQPETPVIRKVITLQPAFDIYKRQLVFRAENKSSFAPIPNTDD